MKTDHNSPSTPLAALSSAWLTACMQPWAAWQGWTRLMSDQWQQWVDSVGVMPAPWLPALASGRRGHTASVEYFLPWLPRTDIAVDVPDVHGPDMALRMMMRAAWPQLAVVGEPAEDGRKEGPGPASAAGVIDAETKEPPPVAAPARKPRTRAVKPASLAVVGVSADSAAAVAQTPAPRAASKPKTGTAGAGASKPRAAGATSRKPAASEAVQEPVSAAKPAPRRARKSATKVAPKAVPESGEN